MLAIVVLFGAGQASARVGSMRQDPAVSTTVAPDVAGTGSTAVATTGTVADEAMSVSTAPTDPTAARPRDPRADDRKATLIIAGLVAVAIAISLLTIRYWRVTKPVAPSSPEESPGPGVDALSVDAPGESVAEAPAVEVPASEATVATAAVPVVGAGKGAGIRSRRSVAGADHADADAGWEPMHTGEQERVSGQVPRATVRPTRSDRARALGFADSA